MLGAISAARVIRMSQADRNYLNQFLTKLHKETRPE